MTSIVLKNLTNWQYSAAVPLLRVSDLQESNHTDVEEEGDDIETMFIFIRPRDGDNAP